MLSFDSTVNEPPISSWSPSLLLISKRQSTSVKRTVSTGQRRSHDTHIQHNTHVVCACGYRSNKCQTRRQSGVTWLTVVWSPAASGKHIFILILYYCQCVLVRSIIPSNFTFIHTKIFVYLISSWIICVMSCGLENNSRINREKKTINTGRNQ